MIKHVGILLLLVWLLASPAAPAFVSGVAAAPSDVSDALAATIPSAPPNDAPPAATATPALREGMAIPTGRSDLPVGYVTFKTPFEQWLTLLTVATLGITVAALTAMGWRTGLTPDFVRAFIVVVVVFSALFLIAAGYSDKQAAPVYALLGTIVGYIFGRLSEEGQPGEDEEAKGGEGAKPAPATGPATVPAPEPGGL
jgi:hypothetical protein